ncbi:MAG: hypothetical protein ABFC96_12380 [Thermoguttaceae bacterium]
MVPMTSPLLPARFLFRFSAVCKYRDPLWTDQGADLDPTYRLPGLAGLEGRAVWADVRAAWSEAGLAFSVRVEGKKEAAPPSVGRGSRHRPERQTSSYLSPEQSDGLHVWIDTRDVHNVHRANRFCHRFAFLVPDAGARPAVGRGSAAADSPALFLPINRAREQPRPVQEGTVRARFQAIAGGYLLESLVPAEALTGFDPAEHSRLGFTYAVLDREFGEQTFGVGSPMPYREDPSLWATLELTK